MIKNILTSVLLLGFLGNSAYAAVGGQMDSLQEAFLRARALSEEQISQMLESPDVRGQKDIRRYVGVGAVFTPEYAHEKGLVSIAKDMLAMGPFYANYKKMILSALSDFKKYAQGSNPYSLKQGHLEPRLFEYYDKDGKRIDVTTYSIIFLILGILTEKSNRPFEDMNLMRQQAAIEKIKEFLETLSRHR